MSRYGEGIVYFALDATNREQRVKIGYSTNLVERLKALANQTLSQSRPLLLAVEPGGMEREQELHREFKDQRLYGEWFRYGSDLTLYVRALPNPFGWLLENPDSWQYAQGLQITIPSGQFRQSSEDEGIRDPDAPVPTVIEF